MDKVQIFGIDGLWHVSRAGRILCTCMCEEQAISFAEAYRKQIESEEPFDDEDERMRGHVRAPPDLN